MTKTRPWSEIRERIVADPVRRVQIEEGVRAMRAGQALFQLRAELGLPEYELADEELDVPEQATVPAGESDENPYVSTLRDVIAMMGGRLEITAVFPDGRQTLLPDGSWVLADVADTERPDRARDRTVAQVS
jgi:hypothetical protein